MRENINLDIRIGNRRTPILVIKELNEFHVENLKIKHEIILSIGCIVLTIGHGIEYQIDQIVQHVLVYFDLVDVHVEGYVFGGEIFVQEVIANSV